MVNYRVQVHVIESRDLIPKSKSGSSDPICFAEVNKVKKRTEKFKKTNSAYFDHLFFFDADLTDDEFTREELKLFVYDAGTPLRNVLIGQASIGLRFVYNLQDHEIFRGWVGLMDPKTPGIQGYLKISVVVLKPGDLPNPHMDDDEDEEDEGKEGDLDSMVIMPPGIEYEHYEIRARIFRADGLPKVDLLGSADPFVKVTAGPMSAKTKTELNTRRPVWNQELRIPFKVPAMSDVITVDLYDFDLAGDNDLLGTATFNFNDLCDQAVEPRWVNFYGKRTDQGFSDSLSSLVKFRKKIVPPQTEFKGRVLLAIEVREAERSDENPKVISTPPLKQSQEPETASFMCHFDLFTGVEFPISSFLSTVHIRASVGPYVMKSSSKRQGSGGIEWGQQIKEQEFPLPLDTTQMPDLVLEAFVDSSRVGWARMAIEDVCQKNDEVEGEPFWLQFNPDPTSSAFKPNTPAGFILYRFKIGLSGTEEMVRNPLDTSKNKPYELRALIYQARHLIAADDTGSSDPYIKVQCGPKSAKTSTKDQTCYPLWYEVLVMNVELPDKLARAPNITIQVFDYDAASGDDLLGRFVVAPKDVFGSLEASTPKWYPLYMDDPTVTQGEVLCAFELRKIAENEKKAAKAPVPDIKPETKDCIFEIQAIGLRDMLPVNLLPTVQPYIKFDAGDAKAVVQTRPSRKPTPANPNFLEVLQLPVALPEDPLFCPFVNVRVFDKRPIHDPLCGNTAIDIAPFMPWASDLPVRRDNMPEVAALPSTAAQPPEQADEGEEGEEVNGPPDPEEEQRQAANTPEGIEPDDDPPRGTTRNEMELVFRKPAFFEYNIMKGSSTGGVFGTSGMRTTGRFLGRFRVIEKSKMEQTLAVAPTPDLKKEFQQKHYVARFYIIRARYLVPVDDSDVPDPYIKIKCGKKTLDSRSRHKNNTLSPDFYEYFQLDVTMPGCPYVIISVMDHNTLTADDLIGSTRIDLEQRLYCKDWNAFKKKPKERRSLWSPEASAPQGILEMWVDILTKEEAASTPPESLAPPVPLPFELRLVVWKTEETMPHDKDAVDLQVSAVTVWDDKRQETDTHYRCNDGKGDFNWRMKFPCVLPVKVPRLKLAVWDRELAGRDIQIGEVELNLARYFRRAFKTPQSESIAIKQKVTLRHVKRQGPQGRMMVSLELLTKDDADKKANGSGREAPNAYPTLPPPNRPTSLLGVMMAKLWGSLKKWIIIGGVAFVLVTVIGITVYLSVFGGYIPFPRPNNNPTPAPIPTPLPPAPQPTPVPKHQPTPVPHQAVLQVGRQLLSSVDSLQQSSASPTALFSTFLSLLVLLLSIAMSLMMA